MHLFRRSSSKAKRPAPAAPPAIDLTKAASVDPAVFESENNRLDNVEARLKELRLRQYERTESHATSPATGSIEPSAGRVNEVDLRTVIDLRPDQDSDFEDRFAAFASHTDELRRRGWLGSS